MIVDFKKKKKKRQYTVYPYVYIKRNVKLNKAIQVTRTMDPRKYKHNIYPDLLQYGHTGPLTLHLLFWETQVVELRITHLLLLIFLSLSLLQD